MAERVVQTCCCCCAPTFHPDVVTCNINGNALRTPHPLGDDFGTDLPLLFKLREI